MRGVNHRSLWSVAAAGDGKTGDLAASTKTQPFVADTADGSVHLILTGTPTGTVTLYASDDHDPGDTSDRWNGTWESVNSKFDTPIVQPTGSAASYLLEFPVKARAFYADYARSAGSGSARATWSKAVL